MSRAFPSPHTLRKLRPSRLLVAMWLGIPLTLCAAPRISEFMAENKETLKDEDGQFSDWIEIHNPDAMPANLADCTLTDDAALPRKWVLPSIVLPPRGRLVIFASGKNRRNAGAELHTNFSLEKSGEFLGFYAANGAALTEILSYPNQKEDISYGYGRAVTTTTLLATGAACRWKIPTTEIPGWETPAFDDSLWSPAQTGVGYDVGGPGGPSYLPYFGAGGDVRTAMHNVSATCYVRSTFPSPVEPSEILSLNLRMRFEDGFEAYLNGTKVESSNMPLTVNLASVAPTFRRDWAAVTPADHDITAHHLLLPTSSPNVLAVLGLNIASNNSDFLISPEIIATHPDPTAPEKLGFFAMATPGTVNGESFTEFTDAPDFSIERGFFTQNLAVALTSKTMGASIRFTTDGTQPTPTHGTLYTAPVAVSGTTVIRAIAYRDGWKPSHVIANSYLFPAQIVQQPAAPPGFSLDWGFGGTFATTPIVGDYEMDPNVTGDPAYAPLLIPALTTTLPVVSLSTDAKSLFDPPGIYAESRYTDTEVPISMEFFDPATGESLQQAAGLRIHGGNAREHWKKPLRLYFRKAYSKGKLRHRLFPGSRVEAFDHLVLRPGGHDGWAAKDWLNLPTGIIYHATYLRDSFVRQTIAAMGQLSAQGRYVHLYINGLYWGVYDLEERPSASFFAAHLGGQETDYDVLRTPNLLQNTYDVAAGSGAAWDALRSRADAGVETAADYEFFQNRLDLDNYIDNLIARIWAADIDWMRPFYHRGTGTVDVDVSPPDTGNQGNKNWYAARNATQNGKFILLAWDAEFSMGLSNFPNSLNVPPGISSSGQQQIVGFNHTRIGSPLAPSWFYAALRRYPDFRVKFADRLQKHFFNDGALSLTKNQERLAKLENTLKLPMVAESARWGDSQEGQTAPTTFTRNGHWQPEVDWLKNTFLTQRNGIVLEQFRSIGLFPYLEAPSFSQFGGTVASGFLLGMTNPNASGTIYYTLNGMDPQAAGTVQTRTLLPLGAALRYWVPTSGTLGTNWRNLADPANLASWSHGTSAVGFDQAPSNTYGPHIATNVAAAMNGTNATIYVRIPFTIASAQEIAAITRLTLRCQYDDGFFAYLNGGFLAAANAGGSAWNSAATAERPDEEAVQFAEFDASQLLHRLVVGTNILAIQGMNRTAADDDFLLGAELTVREVIPGGVAAGSLTYTSEVPLGQSGTVKARVLSPTGEWSALTEAAFIVGQPASPQNLVISEFSYHPADPSQAERNAGFLNARDFEYIEILNISNAPVELAGVAFTNGIVFDFANATTQTLAAGGRALIAANPAALAMRHGAGLPIIGTFANGSNLSNGGERITLTAANNATISSFRYEDGPPWPEIADKFGYSLVLRNPFSDPDPELWWNWRASMAIGGTPGGTDEETFAAWASRLSQSSDPLADPDSDGVANLLEYAAGTSPSVRNSAPLATGAVEIFPSHHGGIASFVFSYQRQKNASDARYRVESSTNLQSWTQETGIISVLDHENGIETWTVRLATPISGSPKQFVRLLVEKP